MIIVDKQERLTHEVLIAKAAPEIEQMQTWCYEQLGIRFSIVERTSFGRNGVWQCRYSGRHDGSVYIFSFDHEKDAVFFKLKWS